MLTEMEKDYLIKLIGYKIEEMYDLNDEEGVLDEDIDILEDILEKLNP